MVSDGASSSKSKWKYHVFLSFRGEDTRRGFTDHLYRALQRRGIITFRDDEQLERGAVISQELLQAIEESLSAVVILSQNYASSTWCLYELQKILESRKELGREVFPVFYGVDPSDVRHQRGSFAEAFRKHEERFGDDKERVKKWRDTLNEVAGLSGWDSMGWHETKLIEEIVAHVWTKLQPKFPCFNDGLVGIESKMEEINSLLRVGLSDVHFVGIWGMGGIGKTILVRTIYDRISSQFDISCFLANVREDSEKNGLVHLQRQLLSRLRSKSMEIDDLYEGKNLIRRILCNKKILLVLDDVSHMSQLENLAGEQGWFGPGSRVIVTTRYMHLLTSHGGFELCEAKMLDSEDSLKLFCQKAFKRDIPLEGYLELSERVVQHAGGLPLALEVLGSYLCGKSIHEWECALDKIRKDAPEDIMKVLRISYEALDDMEKNIFLDVACFLKGMDKNRVIKILEICGLYPDIGIPVLIQKSLLIEYYEFGAWCLGMHDILQEMGKNIVFQQSLNDASKRSRLWLQEDIDHVLTKNKGTELIKGILLELPHAYEARWNPEAFSNMSNLSILIILCNLCLPLGLKCLSNSLKILEWKGYPLKALPPGVQLDELVDLKMHHSKIKQLVIGTQPLKKLKFIDLSHSEDLIQTPDFSVLPNLESLILEGCINLFKVHPSLGHQKKLVVMNLKDCKNLKGLPAKLEMDSLKQFILSGCSNVKKLPEFGETMDGLIMLDLKDCKNLACLPSSICNLKSLKILNMTSCSKFSSLPDNMDENGCLEELDVSGTAIREISPSILHLQNLKVLSFSGCSGPTCNSWKELLPIRWIFRHGSSPVPKGLMLPPSISSLSSLIRLDLSYCNLSAGSIPDDIGCLPSLKELLLNGNNFGNLPAGCSVLPPSFSKLTSLLTLDLSDCNLGDGSIPDDLSCLSSLNKLRLQGNNFTCLPAGCLSNLFRLEQLWLSRCQRLKSLPELPPNVRKLMANDCPSIELPSYPPWNVIASVDSEVFCLITGNKIPSWFNTQSYNFLETVDVFNDGHFLKISVNSHGYEVAADSIVSMKVDIPQFCLSNDGWGISVCLVIENMAPEGYAHLWSCAILFTPKAPVHSFFKFSGWWATFKSNYPHLLIAYLPCNFPRDGCNQLELIFYTTKRPKSPEVKWESRGTFIIRKCGWRLIRKKYGEKWHTTMKECSSDNRSEIKLENLDGAGVSSEKRSRGEFEGGDAAVFDADAETHPAQRRKLQ